MKTIDLNNVRPEPSQGHTSKGNQPKWQIEDTWYKADHMGYEALTEVLISRLLEQSTVCDFVKYQPVQIIYDGKTVNGCASRNFRAKNEMLIPFERLHRAYHGQGLAKAIAGMESSLDRIQYTVDFVEAATGLENVGAYLTALMEIDSFFLNEDRHTNNLAVIRNENNGLFRLCPVFDNGLSLLSDLNDYPLDLEVYSCISRVKAKPFDGDFDEQVSAAEQLYGTQVRFSFTRDHVAREINAFRGIYSDAILARVERVLLVQMRKYPVNFV